MKNLNLKNKAKSAIIYEGASLIDGKPIVAIAVVKSNNEKTGNMIQTYILRSDIDPREANKTGEDTSICGNCPLKGCPSKNPKRKLAEKRTCYVRIDTGVLNVFKAYKRGSYQMASDEYIEHIGRDRMNRIGTYGDGAAVPAPVWNKLRKFAVGHTAYSHQWGKENFVDKSIYMMSVESLSDAKLQWKMGARTFRVINDVSELHENEILCPASVEAGRKTTCIHCKLCSGTSSNCTKSIAIVKHGNGAKL